MYITTRKATIKAIRKGDKLFMMKDGLYQIPRAGFEFSDAIPESYRSVVSECISRGWLLPVAYMKDKEIVWEALES